MELFVEGIVGTKAEIDIFPAGGQQKLDYIKLNLFTWQGPQNVPNYATYNYTAKRGTRDKGWIGVWPAGKLTRVPGLNPAANIAWTSESPVVGMAVYEAAANYHWGYDVNVVAVDPEGGTLTTNTGGWPPNLLNPNGSYMFANVPVTISGPTVAGDPTQRGVKFIEVGYIQTAAFVSDTALFQAGNTRTSVQLFYGTTPLTQLGVVPDTSPDLDNTRPWYYSLNKRPSWWARNEWWCPSFYSGASGSVIVAALDSPFLAIPATFWVRPPAGRLLGTLVAANLDFRFVSYVAVRTLDTANQASTVFTPRAQAGWSYTFRFDASANPRVDIQFSPVDGEPFDEVTSCVPLTDAELGRSRRNALKFTLPVANAIVSGSVWR